MSTKPIDKLSDAELFDVVIARIEKRFKDTFNHTHRMEYMAIGHKLHCLKADLQIINKDLVRS